MSKANNDTTGLVLGTLIGGAAGYFLGPQLLERVIPQTQLAAGAGYPLAQVDMSQAMVQLQIDEQKRSRNIAMGTYGTALAGAILGGYIGKSL